MVFLGLKALSVEEFIWDTLLLFRCLLTLILVVYMINFFLRHAMNDFLRNLLGRIFALLDQSLITGKL